MPLSPTDDRSPESSALPPQFGLRAVFVVLTVLCCLLAVYRLVTAYVLGILVLLVVTVGAHVAASSLGTRLRERADQRRRREADQGLAGPRPLPSQADFAPVTRLSRRQSLGRTVVIAPIVGGVLGLVVGGWGMRRVLGDLASIASVGVAAIAAGVIGAIGGFLLGSFLHALWTATRDAMKHD